VRPAVAAVVVSLVATGCAFGVVSEGGSSAAERAPQGAARPGIARVAGGFAAPVHVTAPAGEPGRLYVVEQAGRVMLIVNGRRRAQPFLDIRSRVASGGERGLLSLAFHPNYAANRRFYVNYTDLNGHTRVVEFRANAARTRGVIGSARQLLFIEQPYSNHNGGQVAFGPDGLLYVGMGDGGSAGDPENRAQNLGSRLGKLLRTNVDRRPASWQIVGYGLRNPWRFSFDRETGDLWIGDVGQGAIEEIDFTPRSSPGLENYGWDVFEGRARFENKDPNPSGRLVPPIAQYSHSNGCSVSGGFVYRGARVPAQRGRYFYGDYCSGIVWSLNEQGGRARGVRRERFTVAQITSFGEDARGELYLVSHGGTIYRLAP
jgi:glucose/arabinose dehydrogenase